MDVNAGIKKKAVELRQSASLKLPDCIIAATAIYLDIPFITADKDFKGVEELDLFLYETG